MEHTNQPPPTTNNPYTVQANSGAAAQRVRGFVSMLFDFSFDVLITPKIIIFLYALGIVWAALVAVIIGTSGFAISPAVGILLFVIVAPLIFLVNVIVWRVFMEFIVVIFKIAGYASEIAQRHRTDQVDV